jgi:hypothetical protein
VVELLLLLLRRRRHRGDHLRRPALHAGCHRVGGRPRAAGSGQTVAADAFPMELAETRRTTSALLSALGLDELVSCHAIST